MTLRKHAGKDFCLLMHVFRYHSVRILIYFSMLEVVSLGALLHGWDRASLSALVKGTWLSHRRRNCFLMYVFRYTVVRSLKCDGMMEAVCFDSAGS